MIKIILLLLFCMSAYGATTKIPVTMITDGPTIVKAPGINYAIPRTANVNCDAASSIISQKGTAWISSVGNVDANGNCTVNLVAGAFSSTPDCQMTSYTTGGFSVGVIVGGGAQSATAILLDAEDDTGATATAYDVTLFCYGN